MGLEPTTNSFRDCRSYQLSYRAIIWWVFTLSLLSRHNGKYCHPKLLSEALTSTVSHEYHLALLCRVTTTLRTYIRKLRGATSPTSTVANCFTVIVLIYVQNVILFCQGWDYTLWWVPSVITQSLARMVLPLSTRASYGHLVSLNAAFFGEWHFSRHILLFILQSSASLAGCSRSLNPYVFFPNNHIHLASFREPYSLTSMVLRIFHSIPE